MSESMPLGVPIPDDPSDPPGGEQFADLTDEQVESALRGEPVVADEPDPAPEPPAAPEPPTAEPSAATQPAEPAADAADAPPQTAEDRIAALEKQARLERLERQKAEAIADRERFLHSRTTGEIGYLRELLRKQRAPEPDLTRDDGDQAQARPELDDIRSDISALKAERVQQGLAEELTNFQQAFPDSAKDEEALGQIVARKVPDYRDILAGQDVRLARTIIRSILRESYAELQIGRERETKADAATASYDQAARLKARKIAAAPPSTTRTAPQRPRTKSIEDMTDAEVEAAADAYVRSGA